MPLKLKGWERFVKYSPWNFLIFPKKFLIILQKPHNSGGKDVSKKKYKFLIRIPQHIYQLYQLWKNSIFFKQTQISYVFEKSYYFSRIVRQDCYHLVMKNFESHTRTFAQFQLANNREKEQKLTSRVEWMIFLPCYKYGRKIITP